MLVKDIKSIAIEMGINPKNMNKAAMIRAIQSQEGNTPCFKTANGSCDQNECLWREDCLK